MSIAKSSAPLNGEPPKTPSKKSSRTVKSSLLESALEDATDEEVKAEQIKVDLAHRKPDWAAEQLTVERPLWEVASLANGLRPEWSAVKARRSLDKQWDQRYKKMLKDMRHRLLPTRSVGDIFFEPDRPANCAVANNRRLQYLVLVDVASASAFLVKQYGRESLKAEFVALHDMLQRLNQSALVTHSNIDPPDVQEPRKSQDKANETKSSNALAILLYAVVEENFGWSDGDALGRDRTLTKILKCLDRYKIKSLRSMSKEKLEDYLEQGAQLAPRRPEYFAAKS